MDEESAAQQRIDWERRNSMPNVGAMIAFEQGELDEDGVIALFQDLVNSGLAWRLQGFYGRTAMGLIEAGLVERKSE